MVDGDGAQPFTIPLADLTPGQTYHYRVTAENLDGSIATADATFVAPVPPLDAPPMVTGPLSSRSRDVTYDPGAGVTSAEIEIRGGGVSAPVVVGDAAPLGEAVIQLPDADGTYQVRVVRHGAATTTSADVPVVLDRTPPSLAGVGLQVTPAVSADPQRSVTFQPPADAVSAEAQVLDAGGAPVGDPVPLLGTGGSVRLGPGDGTYRVEVTFARRRRQHGERAVRRPRARLEPGRHARYPRHARHARARPARPARPAASLPAAARPEAERPAA